MTLYSKVDGMESNWAADHLQTIRTLMERSAVYRRALAPIMLFAGVLGIAAAVAGVEWQLNRTRTFDELWLATAALAVMGVFAIARRQSINHREPFWSPPTRRVGQALLPALAAGMLLGLLFLFTDTILDLTLPLAFFWMLFYGCALHSAGFFMPRGVKLFGWIFIICPFIWIGIVSIRPEFIPNANWIMGFFFGALHLAYGIYLYLTEKGKNAA